MSLKEPLPCINLVYCLCWLCEAGFCRCTLLLDVGSQYSGPLGYGTVCSKLCYSMMYIVAYPDGPLPSEL